MAKPTYEALEKEVADLKAEIDRLDRPIRSEEKHDEDALSPLQKAELYRSLFESAGFAIVLSDLRTGLPRLFNRKAHEDIGLTAAEFRKTNARSYIMEEVTTFQENIEKLLKGEETLVETQIRSKNGEIRDFLFCPVAVRIDGKRYTHSIRFDITKRKQTENRLKENEAKYRNILENMQDGYFELDLAGNLTFLNDTLCHYLGYSRDEIMRFDQSVFNSPERAQEIYETYNEVFRTGKPSNILNYEFTRPDGAKIVLETKVALLKDSSGKAIGFCGISRDITEKIQQEEALKQSEERYRIMIENANDAIFITQDAEIKYPNQKLKELTGYTIEELQYIPVIDLIHPEDRDHVNERERKRRRGELVEPRNTLKLIKKNNETVWVESNSVQIVWEGRPATLNILRDISLNKKMEERLMQANKMEAIGTLAGGIAHNFNNLLMGIQGNASLMLLEIENDHPQQYRLRNIEELVRQGSDLTKQLLGVAQVGKYEVKTNNINTLLKASMDIFGRTKREIGIHMRFQQDIWLVDVDRSQIEQVLLNLYVNAWHAMPGGGELFIETSNMVLDEYLTKTYGVSPGKYVKISLTDTGIGMDETTLARIFDPFFTTKGMGRGTGLGLASAYGIIKNHYGIINAYSEKGKGSTFNIYLPASEKQMEKESETVLEVLSGRETILLIDDEEIVLKINRDILARLGYQVITAEGGERAVEIYREQSEMVDLVILDMIMPRMNGSDTFDALKTINPKAKVLLSSGYSINGQAQRILDRGCVGFLQKPFNISELSMKLRQILDG